jgi:hypothetical protein
MRKKCCLLFSAGLSCFLSVQAQKKPARLPEPEIFLQKEGDSGSATSPFFLLEADQVPSELNVLRKISTGQYIVSYRENPTRRNFLSLKLRPVNALWKLSPELLVRYQSLTPSSTEMNLIIQSFGNRTLKALENKGQIRILAQHLTSSTYLIIAPSSLLPILLEDTSIYYIGNKTRPEVERELTGFDLSSNKVNAAHSWFPQLKGTEQVISIKENKPDTADIDFAGRYLSSSNASPLIETHATNMATIAAGAGNTFFTGTGVARGAGIRSSNFASLLPDENQLLKDQGVSVQNHSYGVGIENYYGADAAAYDQQMNEDTSLLHVFSSGNRGTETSNTGPYAGITGWANLTGSFKMSKNSLVAGAMDSIGNIVSISSRGPAHDGRIKPELIAYGEDGTSGAAALVSGSAILLQELYRKQTGNPAPSSLLRAVLCNSADETGLKGPDFESGFGVLNLPKSIETIQQHNFEIGSINSNARIQFPLVVKENRHQLKITLAWNDPAALSNSFPALVNDLDLNILDPLGNRILPWILSHQPDALSTESPTTRGKDSLNNIEQITLDNPIAGNYTIEIDAGQLTAGTQHFAIAIQQDTIDVFRFTYPVKNDVLVPGSGNMLRWESTDTTTGSLYYRIPGQEWQLIQSGLDLRNGYYRWTVPPFLHQLQFRMSRNKGEEISDTVSASIETRLFTGFNCPDSFLLYWNPVPSAISYQVYQLGSTSLEPLITTTDTLLIQAKKDNPATHFSIAPVFESTIEGRKAYAFAYNNQLIDCYIQNFLADAAGAGLARLQIELGSTYQVAAIRFERQLNNGITILENTTVINRRKYELTTPASDGLNLYRAVIRLQNGQEYTTRWEAVYQFTNSSYFLFPSPVRQGMPLTLLSKDPDETILLITDMTGRTLIKTIVNETVQSIPTSQLSTGIYIYTIYQNKQRVKTGRIIIQ